MMAVLNTPANCSYMSELLQGICTRKRKELTDAKLRHKRGVTTNQLRLLKRSKCLSGGKLEI
jgi:hypothetical protein